MFFLIPLCLILAGTFIWQEKEEKYVNAVILKGTASLCFVILGFLNGNGSGTARLLCYGLAVGAIADVLLNLRYVFAEKGKLVFLIGILVFLSGHLLYLAAIVPLASAPVVCVLAGAVLSALLLKWIFGRIEAQMAFKIFGIFYIGAIVIMNSFALSNLFTMPSSFTGIFFAGALLFLISDIVLILNTFGPESRFSLRITNLTLYYIGQILIAVSLLFL